MIAFLFVDIQGNILFIPEIRWLFHRNDLIIAHAHVAMGIGVFFMVIAMFVSTISDLKNSNFYTYYLGGILGIFVVLSLNGFVQTGFLTLDTFYLWLLRSFFGFIALLSLITFIHFKNKLSHLQLYNLFGILADGFGGIGLILFASFLYPILGFEFGGKYEYIVFIFVCFTGLIHYLAYKEISHRVLLTQLTVMIRIGVGSVFFALFSNNTLGVEALGIALFDLLFAIYYLIFLYQKKENLCKE